MAGRTANDKRSTTPVGSVRDSTQPRRPGASPDDEARHVGRTHLRMLERIGWIDAQIRAGKRPTCRDIEEKFEIKTRTARRTIEFMRERLGWKVVSSGRYGGYVYEDEPSFTPTVSLSEADVALLLVSARIAREYGALPVGAAVEETMAKIAPALSSHVSVPIGSLLPAVSIEVPATARVEPPIFALLEHATRARRRVRIRYYTMSRDAESDRVVAPLHLRNSAGDWYLVAWAMDYDEPRDFLVARVREAEMLEEVFEAPVDFDLDGYLRAGFGAMRGREPVEAVLVFDAYEARWIRERGVPHPSAVYEELPGGELRVTMTVTSLEGVRRFVLSHGSHVCVVSPEQLRAEVQAEAVRMLGSVERST